MIAKSRSVKKVSFLKEVGKKAQYSYLLIVIVAIGIGFISRIQPT